MFMKYIFLLFCFLLAMNSNAQQKEITSIYRQQPKENGIMKMNIPGWLARMGANLSMDKEERQNPENDAMLTVLKKLRNVRLMTVANPSEKLYQRVRAVGTSKKSNNFKEIITVRDKETFVNVWMRDKLNKRKGVRYIKSLFISVGEENALTLVSVKGKWNLQYLLNNIDGIRQLPQSFSGKKATK